MKTKTKETYSKENLIEYLEKLIMQLRSGIIQVGGQTWQVPPSIELTSVIKEKKGLLKHKLEWQWPTLIDYDEESREELIKWQTSFKQIKKDLAGSFKQLKQAITNGLIPDEELLGEFAEYSRAFVATADQEWQEAATEYMDHVENLFRSVQQNDKESILHELSDLENRMKACHREFR